MGVSEISIIIVASATIIGSIVSVAFCISHKASYTYVDETFMRKDLHSQEYKTLLEKFKELKTAIDELKKERDA